MLKRPKIDIFEQNQFYVYGKDIRRIRYNNGLSRIKVCRKMEDFGYAYYPNKLLRYEKRIKVHLPANEMVCLINAINADYDLKK